ncbi:MAG: glutamate formimidoyltransferase [Chthonomonadales bacterium]
MDGPEAIGGTGSPLVQSAINFSEGRRPGVVEAILDAIRRAPQVHLADWSADFDHNRLVATILGTPDVVAEAVMAAAEPSLAFIDLRSHRGAHPRIGAMDVVPLVPVRNVSTELLVERSVMLAQELARRYDLPVYLYEQSARANRPSTLPHIRNGGFEALAGGPLTGARAPDFGPPRLHPTAGATVVGVRGPLVAYNVILDEPEGFAAGRIASAIRKDRKHLPELWGVRALAMVLPSRRRSQVSMNITHPDATPLPPIFRYVARHADREGVRVVGSEIIGLVPSSALAGEPPENLACANFRQTQFLDYWLERIP